MVAPYASALALAVAPRDCHGQSAPTGQAWSSRPLRFLRGGRLHAGSAPGKGELLARAGLHGPPSGHDIGRPSAMRSTTTSWSGALAASLACAPPNCSCRKRVPWEFPPERASDPETHRTPTIARTPTRRRCTLDGAQSAMSPVSCRRQWKSCRLDQRRRRGARSGGVIRCSRAGPATISAVAATRASISASARSGTVRSLGGREPGDTAETNFHAHKVEFHERMEGLSSNLEIAVAPSDDVEIRRINLFNDSNRMREIDVHQLCRGGACTRRRP